jgi:rhodanese-related sulfurtransferase
MEDIEVQELKERLDNGEKINLIDVREEWEFEEFNLNGKLIPLGQLPTRLSELDSLKDEEIIIHCRSGNRSGQAKRFMEQQGFKKVRNLLGGTMAWEAL